MTSRTAHPTPAQRSAPAQAPPAADTPPERPGGGTGRPPVVALLVRWWPVLPALATVLLLCWPADREDITATTHVTPADAATVLVALVCVVVLLRRRQRPLAPEAALVLAAPAVAFALATALSSDPVASLPGFVRYLQIFVVVPVALVLTLRSRRDFRAVAAAVVLAALVQGVIGIQQYATGTGASYAGQDIRAVGTFGPLDIMGLATVVSHGVVIALAVGLSAPASAPPWLRPAAFGCAALLMVPLAMSFSRGAWISTVLAAVAVLLLTSLRTALRTLALLLAAAVVLVGGAGVGSDLIGERLTSITQVADAPDRSVTDRYAMWSAAVGIWRDAPATGVGLKGFPAHRDGHASIGLSASSDTGGAGVAFRREPLLSPHNMYLLVLSEQGLVGVTLVVGSWAALLVLGLRRVARTRGHRRRPVDCGLVAVGLLVLQFADFLYADIGGPSTALTAIMFGLVAWWALSPAAAAEKEGGR